MRGVTRRTFLASAAAGALARRGFSASAPRVVVVGAGAFGGWTALQLRRRGANVTLIDRWSPGNLYSSSGGKTRVIRAIYGPDRIYVEMVKRAFELWEKLDPSLYTPTGALWMHRDSDSYVRAALPILTSLGFVVDPIEVAEAAKRWPQINFKDIQSVYLERRAGALAARHACGVVRDTFVKEGGTYREGQASEEADIKGKLKSIPLADGKRLEADVFVFACGPWLGRMFPDVIDGSIKPTKQEVYYFDTKGSDRFKPDHLPIWIDFGRRIVYGIPDVDGHGLKVADDTRGEPFDPTTGKRTPSEAGIERARAFLKERFPELANAPIRETEVCQYENSPDGNLIADRHPAAENLWLLGGGSGHGFKLSPAVGEMAAAAILDGKELPKMFRIARLPKAAKKTQFDIKS